LSGGELIAKFEECLASFRIALDFAEGGETLDGGF